MGSAGAPAPLPPASSGKCRSLGLPISGFQNLPSPGGRLVGCKLVEGKCRVTWLGYVLGAQQFSLPLTHSGETEAQSGVQVLPSAGTACQLRAQGAALGGRRQLVHQDGFLGLHGEVLITLPAQLASWGAAAGGMGGTPSGPDSSRLARRRVGASGGRRAAGMPPEPTLLAPTRCTGGERGPGRLVGPSQARAEASVGLRVARLQPSQRPSPGAWRVELGEGPANAERRWGGSRCLALPGSFLACGV